MSFKLNLPVCSVNGKAILRDKITLTVPKTERHFLFHLFIPSVDNRHQKQIRRDGYGYPDDEYFFLKVIDLSRCPSSARKHDRLLKKTTGHILTTLYSQII